MQGARGNWERVHMALTDRRHRGGHGTEPETFLGRQHQLAGVLHAVDLDTADLAIIFGRSRVHVAVSHGNPARTATQLTGPMAGRQNFGRPVLSNGSICSITRDTIPNKITN